MTPGERGIENPRCPKGVVVFFFFLERKGCLQQGVQAFDTPGIQKWKPTLCCARKRKQNNRCPAGWGNFDLGMNPAKDGNIPPVDTSGSASPDPISQNQENSLPQVRNSTGRPEPRGHDESSSKLTLAKRPARLPPQKFLRGPSPAGATRASKAAGRHGLMEEKLAARRALGGCDSSVFLRLFCGCGAWWIESPLR